MKTLERIFRAWCAWRGHQLIRKARGPLFYTECIRCGWESSGIITGTRERAQR